MKKTICCIIEKYYFMHKENIPYEKQIFVCTNDLKGEKPSCGDHQAQVIFKELRRIAKERGLHPRIRIAQAKCLGKCSMGANIMIYSRHCEQSSQVGTPTEAKRVSEPDQTWYSNVRLEDVENFSKKYLKSS